MWQFSERSNVFFLAYIGHFRPKRGRYSDPGSRGREHESTGEMLDSLIVRAGEKVCTILFFSTVQGSVNATHNRDRFKVSRRWNTTSRNWQRSFATSSQISRTKYSKASADGEMCRLGLACLGWVVCLFCYWKCVSTCCWSVFVFLQLKMHLNYHMGCGSTWLWSIFVFFRTRNACKLSHGVWIYLILIHICLFSY